MKHHKMKQFGLPKQAERILKYSDLQPQFAERIWKTIGKRDKKKTTYSILFIGDPHFGPENSRETSELQRKTQELIQGLDIDAVVVLGDIMNSNSRSNSNIESPENARASEFLLSIQKLTELVVVIGNHDMINWQAYQDRLHHFRLLDGLPRTHLVDVTKSFALGPLNVLGSPYVEPGRFADALEDHRLSDYDLIVCHQEFLNAQYGYERSTAGDLWPATNPLVVSGHIHNYEWLSAEPKMAGTPNILYTGTPMMHSHAERHGKSVSILKYDLETHTSEEVRINLEISEKVSYKVAYEELRAWEPPADLQADYRTLRVESSGTYEQKQVLQKTGVLKRFAELGVALKFTVLPAQPKEEEPVKYVAETISEPAEKLSYQQVVQSLVAARNNTSLTELYESL